MKTKKRGCPGFDWDGISLDRMGRESTCADVEEEPLALIWSQGFWSRKSGAKWANLGAGRWQGVGDQCGGI